MTEAMETKDSGAIADLFAEDFLFKGCEGDYDKSKIVALIGKVPVESPFSFSFCFKSAKYHSADNIFFSVIISGFGPTPVEAQFVLSISRKKTGKKLELSEGSVPACKRTHFHGLVAQQSADEMVEKFVSRMTHIGRSSSAQGNTQVSFQQSDAEVVVMSFLKKLTAGLEEKDAEQIGNLFGDDFLFKGCRGTYNKAETLAKINQVPEAANFNFALKSANWNKNGQIEYTVTISGALLVDFDAQFVYCPYLQVLKSGRIPSCPAKRMFANPCLDDPPLFR
ncbi:hypothetical protein CAEBREN_05326 [Caenorhabditis brenneri]|uniref:NTF2-like domain-containing protein n=1 Tax=Caenorhabditis brenneri TaxID=135651 RepID=G0MQS3_CAEBE|nr:hypothetical protein CAEBREN_05326 [Caenorhabditis brenneri]